MKAYIASSFRNAENVRALRDALAKCGVVLTYDWTKDDFSKELRGETNGLNLFADAELRGIALADFVVVLLPGGRGTHVELGFALGRPALRDKVFVCGPTRDAAGRECCFYYARGARRVPSAEPAAVLAWLLEERVVSDRSPASSLKSPASSLPVRE